MMITLSVTHNMESFLVSFTNELKKSFAIKLGLIVGLVVFISILWHRRRLYFTSMILPGPIGLPLFGNAIEMKVFTRPNHLIHILNNFKKQYGEIFRIWLGPELAVVLSEPEDIKCVNVSKIAASKGSMYEILKKSVGDGLLTASGELWKRHRQIINPSFNKNFLKSLFFIHNKHSKHLVDNLSKIKNDTCIDITIYIQRCTADIINDGLFDNVNNFYEGKYDHILKLTITLTNLFYNRMCKVWLWSNSVYKHTPEGKLSEKLENLYHNHFKPSLCKKLDLYVKNKSIDNIKTNDDADITSSMKNCFEVMADSVILGKMTKDEFIDEFNNIYNPGIDSTYSLLCLFIMMMAMHKECQNKLWQEIQIVFSDDLDADVLPDHLPKLKYLDMCLKENSRLHPTGPTQMRHLDEDLELPHRNLKIPKGTSLLLATYSLHRNPKYWEKPNEYDPDRFEPEISKQRPEFSFVPFSAGLRNCIGQFFALDMMKVIVINLIRNFEFDTDLTMDKFKVDANISVRSVLSHWVNIKKRERF